MNIVKTLDHACTRTGHVDTHEIMTVATIFGTLGEHHLMLALEIIAQRIRVSRVMAEQSTHNR